MFKKAVEAKSLQRLSGADKKKLRRTVKEKESAEGCYVPNAGFFSDAVFPDPSSSPSLASHSCEDDTSVDQKSDNEEAVEPGAVDNVCSEHDPASSSQMDDKNDDSEQVVSELSGLKVAENESQHSLSTEDVDVLLNNCLLQALHTTVKDKDLPLPGIKEDKYKKEVVLLSVNRTHVDYTSFKPVKRQLDKTEQSSDQAVADSQSQNSLEIEEVYKSSIHVNPIFAAVGADTGAFFSASGATNVAFAYVEKENLVKPTNKAMVTLDAMLCDALFKGAIKKGTAYPTEIHKKDLGTTFLSRMQAHHKVTRGSDSVIRKGAVKPIHILTERRQGNKKVTKLSGFEIFLMDAESLASELQKKFACSTTVSELPGKKGHEVLVQGGVIDHLAKHLIDQYGVPKRYIEIEEVKTKIVKLFSVMK
ncbi:Eukaryotic translation initiation factor 2D [Bienertia sinuspersici]